ncbi:unnamed protein product [Zymoseptoria tritici ST99CH_3D1]|uniref:AvrStb6 n=1 Tax=Zymoseptoria tritici TaxID=1047171 RepID=A0A2K9YW11_ZYMTR|nr:AvrStb6 [Zymoseptoria tritici]AUW40154.1 AvrStb6 [Zymoseptoria tritici]QWA19230.1 avirulence factor AvrStb6 [Zymoseptoria tritici]SMR53272.1 unnamed protein product [Zymoseptoria tritici ST99CH_3D1]
MRSILQGLLAFALAVGVQARVSCGGIGDLCKAGDSCCNYPITNCFQDGQYPRCHTACGHFHFGFCHDGKRCNCQVIRGCGCV